VDGIAIVQTGMSSQAEMRVSSLEKGLSPAAEVKHDVAATAHETKDESAAPMDHGLHAWTVVAGAWCCLFCGFGWVNGELVHVTNRDQF
jgi:hypothetical protein